MVRREIGSDEGTTQVFTKIGAFSFTCFIVGYFVVRLFNYAILEDILIQKLFKKTTKQKYKRRQMLDKTGARDENGRCLMPKG